MPQTKNEIIEFLDCYPGGNDTYLCLPQGWSYPHSYLDVDAAIRKFFTRFEQGGFLEASVHYGVVRLQMAGGEFCVNALRAVVACIADDYWNLTGLLIKDDADITEVSDTELEFAVEASGVESVLPVSCLKTSRGYYATVEVPLPSKPLHKFRRVVFRNHAYDVAVVHLDGISHILLDQNRYQSLSLEDAAEFLREHEIRLGVDSAVAVGLVWYCDDGKQCSIDPIVYVRMTGSLVRESACGSGSIAVALWRYLRGAGEYSAVVQPSKELLNCTIERHKNGSLVARIGGLVLLRGRYEIEIPGTDTSP